MNQFDLNEQWKLYLKRGGVTEDIIPEDQKREMKRAFYGACGQMLILMRDDVTEYGDTHGDDAAVELLKNMTNQVNEFWKGEVKKQFGE